MIFEQGDIVTFDLSPSKGHEPQGRRPALVISNLRFNTGTSMTLVCPITTANTGYPLHFQLPDGLTISGWVVAEQVRAYDLDARDAHFVESIPDATLKHILQCIKSFF